MVKNYGGLPRPSLGSEFVPTDGNDFTLPVTTETVVARVEEALENIGAYPRGFQGRGIVICGGGRYFASAYVLIRMLRRQRCHLPIELWYLGETEMDERMCGLVEPLGVRCVDALEMRKTHPMRILNGWESKSYAVLHSAFEEVLFLDADNLPVINPTYLFDSPEFKAYGAVFWPDIHRRHHDTSLRPELWKMLGNDSPLGVPEFESAQMLIHKGECWRALNLCAWFNANSDFFYQHMYGDKETFHLAWATTRAPFGMPSAPIQHHHGCLCQHDFEGRRVFQHRHGEKFSLHDNVPVAGFRLESECLLILADLARRWDGRIGNGAPKLSFLSYAPAALQSAFAALIARPHTYLRIGYDSRQMEFLASGSIGGGGAFYEQFWDLRIDKEKVCLTLSSPVKPTCQLFLCPDGAWRGKWEHSGEMEIKLS